MSTGFYHGVRTRQMETSLSTPVTAGSGISFVVGTAPVHTVNGKINDPVYGGAYNETVEQLGYSDDWKKYSLCEVMYSHFRLYNTAPVIFVNVLDPEKHKINVEPMAYPVSDLQVRLPLEALSESVKVSDGASGEYAAGEDYELLYSGNELILEIADGGKIPETVTELTIEFEAVDPSKITKADIIGGFNVSTKKTTGLELIDTVFPKYNTVPDIIICPGWSHDPEVAAIMVSKAENINGVFLAKAICDVDTKAVRHYADVTAWKKQMNIFSKTQVLCFPMVKLGDRIFHLSVQMAGLMGKVDSANDACPAESPSNKLLQINSTVLEDGTEVLLDLQQGNYLNSNGVTTAINWIGGFVLWGNYTACYPAITDVKDFILSNSRMFGWVGNSLVLTFWSKVDKKMTRRFADSIIDSVNIWLNGLVSEEKLMGGRVELRPEENNVLDLKAGKITFHVFMTPYSPAQEIEFVQEYDVSYVEATFR